MAFYCFIMYITIALWKLSVFYCQIINVYNQEYESGARFWPDVHRRIIIALIVSQILLMGLMSTKHAANSTPLILVLPVLTIWFHFFCKSRFEPAFVKFPLQVCTFLLLMSFIAYILLALELSWYCAWCSLLLPLFLLKEVFP